VHTTSGNSSSCCPPHAAGSWRLSPLRVMVPLPPIQPSTRSLSAASVPAGEGGQHPCWEWSLRFVRVPKAQLLLLCWLSCNSAMTRGHLSTFCGLRSSDEQAGSKQKPACKTGGLRLQTRPAVEGGSMSSSMEERVTGDDMRPVWQTGRAAHAHPVTCHAPGTRPASLISYYFVTCHAPGTHPAS